MENPTSQEKERRAKRKNVLLGPKKKANYVDRKENHQDANPLKKTSMVTKKRGGHEPQPVREGIAKTRFQKKEEVLSGFGTLHPAGTSANLTRR